MVKATLRQTWKDPRLTWDPTAYNGISGISFHTNTMLETSCIWAPDLQLVNNVLGITDLAMVSANVFSDGTVYQAKLGNLRTMLNFDLTQFPFDR